MLARPAWVVVDEVGERGEKDAGGRGRCAESPLPQSQRETERGRNILGGRDKDRERNIEGETKTERNIEGETKTERNI
jgi:hypothetical protein